MIYLEDEPRVKKRLASRELNVAVVGLGTIGLPVAIHYAHAGYRVLGVDVDAAKVERINAGTFQSEYPEELRGAVAAGRLRAVTDIAAGGADCDVFILCVPTPLTGGHEINLSYLESAIDRLAEVLRRGALVVVESAVTPGVTRALGQRLAAATGLEMDRDFAVANCPERYNPGLPLGNDAATPRTPAHRREGILPLLEINRVVGGSTSHATFVARELYASVVKGQVQALSSPEAAECTKLLENIFRDVNIALINELSRIFVALGVDAYEVISAASTKPFAFLPHQPGPGVGGDCIPVDTWYMIRKAEELGCETGLMRLARAVNDGMPAHVVSLVEDALRERGRGLAGANIVLLGLAYKKNVPDVRNSPGVAIRALLEAAGASVSAFDPIVERHRPRIAAHQPFGNLEEAIADADGVVLVTDHAEFLTAAAPAIISKSRGRVLVDARGFYDPAEAREHGITLRAIGRPNGGRT